MRDMTRVAGANPRIWIDIFLDNAEELRASLAEHRRRVEELERALETRDAGWLARWIGEAGGNRRRLLAEAYEDPGTIQRVRVHVPDRPGVLSGITQALGAEKINIEDFELDHLSPERGGTLERARRRRGGRAPRRRPARGAGLLGHRLARLLERLTCPRSGADTRTPPAGGDAAALEAARCASSPASLRGDLAVPGDKSISHRALLLGAIADGESEIDGFGASKDTLSTAAAVGALGAGVEVDGERVRVAGRRPARAPGARRPARLRERRHADAARSRASSPGRRGGSSSSATSR